MENTKGISNQIPETASVLEMAVQYEKANQFELAEEYYKKAYAKGDSFASISLADLYNKQGKLDLAEEWYRKESGDHDSCAGDGNNALAHFLVEQGREDEAWKCFEQILFIDDVDTAPYEGATSLACNLLAQGKYWDKITESTFYLAYLFLDYPYNTDAIHFMVERLQACIDENAPNKEAATTILASLYFAGKYSVMNYYGFETDRVVETPFLLDREKGVALLKTLSDDDLERFALFFEKGDDFASFETYVDLFACAYNILTNRSYQTPDELAQSFLVFLSNEDISNEDIVKLCTKIADCEFWWDVRYDDGYLYDELYKELSHKRIEAIFEGIAPLREEDVSYFLGTHYDHKQEYEKALDAFKRHYDGNNCYGDFAAGQISEYYRERRPGIPQCFNAALDWAAKAYSITDGILEYYSFTGETDEELSGMWKALLHRITTDPSPEIIKYFWDFIEDFEEYYTPEEYQTALAALSEYGDKKAAEALKNEM